MDSAPLDAPCRLSRRFPAIDRAYDFVKRECARVLFREGECTISDNTLLIHIIMRIFDHITGINIFRPSDMHFLRVRERWALLHIRLHRIRTKLGNLQLLASVAVLSSSLRVFIALLRMWTHLRGLRSTWPGWMLHTLHYEFQKYLPLL